MIEEGFMKNLIIFIKGFLFGAANVIPGVSGGTMAIILGVYERILNIFGYFFKDLKENIKFIIPFLLGIFLSVFVMSNVISYALANYPMITFIFFIGLIVGGIPTLYKKVNKEKNISNYMYVLIGFLFVILISLFNNTNTVDLSSVSFIVLFLVGVISASAMIIPGISGSFVLVLLGFYEPIINVIKDILDFQDLFFNLFILIFFGLGILFGIVFISRIIKYLIEKYEIKTYFTIIGFVLASIISIILNIEYSNQYLLFSIFAFSLGFIVSLKLGE
jgi:putative membrane protein